MRKITGQYGVLLTPFNREYEIDFIKLEQICDYLFSSEINGVVVSGTTSEFPCISFEENLAILEFVIKRNSNRKNIVFSACSPSIHQTVKLIKSGERQGITEFLVCPPYYMPITNEADIYEYYKQILSETNSNIILYNIPICTQSISISLFKKLALEPRVIGIKDSTGNFKSFVQYLNLTKHRNDFSVLVGSDEILQYGLLAGCHGSMTALGSIAPQIGSNIYKNYLIDYEKTDKLQKLTSELVAMAETMVFPDGYKLLFSIINDMDCGEYIQPNHFTNEMKMELIENMKKQWLLIKKEL